MAWINQAPEYFERWLVIPDLSAHPEDKSAWAGPLKAAVVRAKELKKLAAAAPVVSADVDTLMTPRA